MKRNILVFVFIICFLLIATAWLSAEVSNPPCIRIVPAQLNLNGESEQHTITIEVVNLQEEKLGAFDLWIYFDNELLQFENATLGEPLKIMCSRKCAIPDQASGSTLAPAFTQTSTTTTGVAGRYWCITVSPLFSLKL